jgi:hypothetical protein
MHDFFIRKSIISRQIQSRIQKGFSPWNRGPWDCGGLKAEAKYRLCFDRICFIGFIGLYVIYHVLEKTYNKFSSHAAML